MKPQPLTAPLLRTCSDAAAELLSQREFFTAHRDDLPEPSSQRPNLAAPRYSGTRSDDEELNLRVGAMRLLRFSDRAIERECGVDRRTIPHRLTWLERTGRIPALKDRVTALTGSLAESSALVLSVLLDRAATEISVELAAMIKAVATTHGITVEKLQLLTGQATEIVETRVGAGRDDFETWWRQAVVPIQATATPAVDSASSPEGPIPEQSSGPKPLRHAADTSTRGPATEDRGGGDAFEAGGPEGAIG